MEWAYNKAREVSAKEAKRSKKRYDQKVRCSKLDIGDIVLVRQKGFTGKHKVADRWEKDYYEVMSQKSSEVPVFVVKSLGKDKRVIGVWLTKMVWFVGSTGCTLQTLYAWLVRGLYVFICVYGWNPYL